MSDINTSAGFPPVPTFAIVHPDKPEAGEVVVDDACFPAWSANGWITVEDAAAMVAAAKKGKK